MSKKDTKGRNLKQNESQMADGRYRYRYTDAYGKRHVIYSWKLVPMDKVPQGKKDDISLREKIKQIERDLEDGIKTADANITTNQLIEKYLSTKKTLANKTIENYLHMWNKNIKNSVVGNMNINKVKKSDILKLYSMFYAEKKFSVHTIQLYQNLLYPAFQLAVDDSLIRLNPCRNCMKDYSQGSMSSAREALSLSEQKTFLLFVREHPIYKTYYPLFVFLLGTGCRISEALGVTWNDINFKEKTISINHQIIYGKVNDSCKFYASPTKTKLPREIPMLPNVEKALEQIKEESYIFSINNPYEIDGYDSFVFLNSKGHVYKQETINRAINAIVRNYNQEADKNPLPNISPHIFRHTFCTRMAESGIDVKVLQEIMGHANIAVTMQVYNHVNKERVQLAIKDFDMLVDDEENS